LNLRRRLPEFRKSARESARKSAKEEKQNNFA
jgi:hypothetical protein